MDVVKFKQGLTYLTKSQLEELTGKTFRTIRKRLDAAGIESSYRDANAEYFNARDALPAIYIDQDGADHDVDDEGNPIQKVDPAKERGLLDRTRRKKVEIEVKVLESKLIPIENVKQILEDLATAVRAKILGASSKLSITLVGVKDPKDIKRLIDGVVEEILDELSKSNPEDVTPLAYGPETSDVADE